MKWNPIKYVNIIFIVVVRIIALFNWLECVFVCFLIYFIINSTINNIYKAIITNRLFLINFLVTEY